MMLIESGILLENMLVAIYAKRLHHIFIATIFENFKNFFTHVGQAKSLET